jgi:hypothetical protein
MDLINIRKALDMYFADNGTYPPTGCGYDCNGYYYSVNSSWQTLENYLRPYISSLPKDPVNNSGGPWNSGNYSYTYGNSYRNPPRYDLTAQLETINHPLSCGQKNWKFHYDDRPWCTNFGGEYSNQIFEASPLN